MTDAPDREDRELQDALERAARLTTQAAGVAVALADFDIELPPSSAVQVDQAQLRAIAGLYLASELEAAGVTPAVEAMAGLSGGGMNLDLGGAAGLVRTFWRARNERPSPAERQAIFARLFGDESGAADADGEGNDSFELDLIELTEALYKLDELAQNRTYGGLPQQTRVRRAAERLIEGLVAASGSLTVFVAQELLQTLKLALAILQHADVRRALRARDTWDAVAAAARIARLPRTQPRLRATRGKAGMTILAWLADAAPHLADTGQPLLALDHPVIPAAIDWLEAALELGESSGGAAPAASEGSPWAAIAG